jgi:acetoin:2,6-dichlorophenolindophenol oxidoreductase subunit alpha
MKLDKKKLITLYSNLVRSRAFDRLFVSRLTEGKLLGFYHPAEGGEAPGVGACSFLKKDDIIWPHIRGHGLPHMIAKGIDVKHYLAEHSGKATGMCNGMSTFHLYDEEFGVYGWAGAIGSNFPVSVGWGLAAQKNKRKQVVVSCFGDGTSNRGTLHEAFLTAASWKLPIVWLCENNGISLFVPADNTHPKEDIASLADGYGMPAAVVDGQDVVAVAEAVGVAVERARKGKGPSFIEAKCLRFGPHAIGIPDMVDSKERSAKEIDELRKRDPVDLCRNKLMEQGILTQKEVDRIDKETAVETAEAEKFADESPIPDPAVFDEYLYAT